LPVKEIFKKYFINDVETAANTVTPKFKSNH